MKKRLFEKFYFLIVKLIHKLYFNEKMKKS